jgi:hypothetical protein
LDLETENRNLREAASHLFTSNQPLSQEITMAEIPISIAYPADKVTAFAQTLKQDSQLQSFASSSTPSTMYPIAVDVDSVPPPLASVVPSTTNQDSSSSSSTRSSTSTSTRRIQPIPLQVNAVDKRRHFSSKLHAYFVHDDYAPDIPQFEKDFLNDCIIYHCCRNDKMIQLPPFSEAVLQGIKDFQSNNLIRQLSDTQIAPSLMLEVMCTFMEHIFVIQRSTIPNSGQGPQGCANHSFANSTCRE